MQEIEVSIFGGSSGYGESIVINDGFDNWAVIDSFVSNNKSVPLKYLNDRGVSPTKVKYIIATHWDNDHINGLVDLFDECINAEFVCTSAYHCTEFFTLIEADKHIVKGARSLSIFDTILKKILSRNKVPMEAIQDFTIWKDNNSNLTLVSLSPSSKAVYECKLSLLPLIDNIKASVRIPSLSPNDRSVVLYLNIKGLEIVLGADLEVTTDPDKGWNAVHKSQLCPNNIVLFKVPHHGSQNGFFQPFWSTKLSNQTRSCTTAFASAGLPKASDVKRILNFMPNESYMTSPTTIIKSAKFDKSVNKLLERLGKDVMDYENGDYGQVQFKCDVSNSTLWKIEHFGSAFKL